MDSLLSRFQSAKPDSVLFKRPSYSDRLESYLNGAQSEIFSWEKLRSCDFVVHFANESTWSFLDEKTIRIRHEGIRRS